MAESEWPPAPDEKWLAEETEGYTENQSSVVKKHRICLVKKEYTTENISLSRGDYVMVTHESNTGYSYVLPNKTFADDESDGEESKGPKDWVPTDILEDFSRTTREKNKESKSKVSARTEQSNRMEQRATETPTTNIIKVLGLPQKSTKDEIKRYFEDKRKQGGGKIISIDYDERNSSAIITFKDSKSAERVMSKLPLEFKDTQIHVELMPIEDSGTSSDESSEEDPIAPQTTIEVRGFDPSISQAVIELHFEKKRVSGGGDVSSCEIFREEGFARVTFESEEVMERVLQTRQVLEGKELEVKQYVPPPPPKCYSNKIFISGININRDTLELVLEKNTKAKPVAFLEGEEEGTMLVTFDSDLDIRRIQSAFKFEKKFKLVIEPVAITNTIIVSNVDLKTTKDALMHYFENTRRSGGGEVIDIQEENTQFKIQFEENSCVSSVCEESRVHSLDGKRLDVCPYYQCLHNNPENETTASTVITGIDSTKIKFLKKANIERILEEKRMKIIWKDLEDEGSAVEIECTITKSCPDRRKLLKTWTQEARKTYLEIVDSISIAVHDNIFKMTWGPLLLQMKSLRLLESEDYYIIQDESERKLQVVGYTESVENVSQKIRDIIENLECERKKKQDENREEMPLESHKLDMFVKLQLEAQLREKFPNLQIDVSEKELIFTGLFTDISAGKLFVLEKLMQLKNAEVGQFSHKYLHFLRKEAVKNYLGQRFEREGITAAWEVDSTKRLIVYSTSDKSAVKAAHLIRDSIVETKSAKLPENSECVLYSDALQEKINYLNRQYDGQLEIKCDLSELFIEIYSVSDHSGSVLEVINEFLKQNTLHEQSRKKSKGVLRYLEQLCTDDISKTQTELKDHFVEISIGEDEIRIKGNQYGLAQAKLAIEKLSRKIVKRIHIFKSAGVLSQIGTMQGLEKIQSVEEAMKCIVDVPDPKDDEEDRDEEISSPYNSPKEWASCKMDSGLILYCIHGDIVQLKVNAIVNAADRYLKLEGGLARVIAEKGGRDVYEDCRQYISKNSSLLPGDVYCGVPGKLKNVQSIFHAVGPIWQGGNEREEDYLNNVVYTCLEEATKREYSSIAFPGVSTGIFNYPVKEAVSTILAAVSEFLDNNETTLNRIYFCDIDFEVVSEFGEQIKKEFGSARVNFKHHESTSGWTESSKGTETKNERPSLLSEKQSLQIVEGDIAEQKVDVIVNLTSSDLETDDDPAKIRVFDRAGSSVRKEYEEEFNFRQDGRELIITQNGNLPCKCIFHGNIPQWENNAISMQLLKEFLNNCLKDAERERYKSIAIPSVVTDKLNFPPLETATTMIKCLREFVEKTKSDLLDVRLVIKEDQTDVFQIFEKQLNETSSRTSTDVRRKRRFLTDQSSTSLGDTDKLGRKPIVPPRPAPRSVTSRFGIGKLSVLIYKGDLPSAKTDALVYLLSDKYTFEGSTRALFEKKGGDRVLKEMDSQKQALHKNKYALCMPGSTLAARFIIMAMWSSSNWKGILKNTLQLAEDKGCESVAYPTLGVNALGKSSDYIIKLHEAISEFQQSEDHRFLKEIHIVVYESQRVNTVLQVMNETAKKGKRNLLSRFGSWLVSGSSNDTADTLKDLDQGSPLPQAESSSLSLVFYAKSNDIIDKAIKELTDRFESQLEPKVLNADIIKEFNTEQIKDIEDLKDYYMIEIKVEKKLGRIRFKGTSENVSEAFNVINETVRQLEKKIQREKEAKRFADVVQWCYLEEEVFQPYDALISVQIEDAYKNKEPKTKLTSDVGEFIIDFDKMVEYPENDSGNMVTVVRRLAFATGFEPLEPPSNWKQMDGSQNLKVVELDKSDQDFKNVTRSFEETSGETSRSIKKVMLIQNKLLYQQYIAKKDLMRRENRKGHRNERYLWHGTSEKSVPSINAHGFNRSYCGKHATLYGHGVYFASQSQYSAQDTYSPPDPSTGLKYMYLCKVLTGEFVKGSANLRVPPQKSSSGGSGALYDSVVDDENDPNTFVIFNDTQAYPEYLITFT